MTIAPAASTQPISPDYARGYEQAVADILAHVRTLADGQPTSGMTSSEQVSYYDGRQGAYDSLAETLADSETFAPKLRKTHA